MCLKGYQISDLVSEYENELRLQNLSREARATRRIKREPRARPDLKTKLEFSLT